MTNVNQSAIRSYRVGSWCAIFGEHASVLLPASEKPRVGALWELVDGGAEFDELLDALIATGLRTLPGFVLVSTAENPTRIVLRGAARATVVPEGGEVVEVDGGAAATWVERAVSNVESLQLLLEEATEEVDYDIVSGLVRVSRVDQPPHVEPVAEGITDEAADVAGLAMVPGTGVRANEQGSTDEVVESDEAAGEFELQPEARPEEFAPVGLSAVPDPSPEMDSFETETETSAVETEEAPASQAPESLAWGQHAGPAPVGWGAAQDALDTPLEPTWGETPETPEAPESPETPETPAEPAWSEAPDSPEAPATPEAPAMDALDTPGWGEQPAGGAETGPASGSNPFAPGAESYDPPIWEPPAAPVAPAWGAAPAVPSWGDEPADSAPGGDEQGAAEHDQDHDGKTLAGSVQPDQFARQHPGIPGQPQAPSVTAQPVANLAFSNGETVEVDRAVLIGRAPEARRFTSTDQPRLMTVPSPNAEISSTHLEVRPGSGVDHGSAIVTDMGSTNGTVLTQPGFSPEELQPSIAVQLLPGAVIDLGDGVTIQVTSP